MAPKCATGFEGGPDALLQLAVTWYELAKSSVLPSKSIEHHVLYIIVMHYELQLLYII